MINLIALLDMVKKDHRVSFESEIENWLHVVDKGGNKTHYDCNERGLSVKLLFPLVDSDVYTFLNTNVEGFTKSEVIWGRRSHKLYHDLNSQ